MSVDLKFKRPGANFSEKLILEKEDRAKNAKDPMSFGVSFLDKATGGIQANDLILIGAKTGAGKTQLVSIIAHENVRLGKRVHYFALEAETYEIERRIKYKTLASMYYSKSRYSSHDINYVDWYNGKLDEVFADIEPLADKILGDAYSGLHTIYPNGNFTIDDFEKSFLAIQDQTDLVIVDHIHYFDFDDTNENQAYKRIAKRMRNLALVIGKPVVCVAHMRKNSMKSKELLPSLEDFHGTSDIPKIATKAIIIGPCYDPNLGDDPGLYKTYMQVAKCRMDSARTVFSAVSCFNVRTQSYESDFVFGRFSSSGETFERIEDEFKKPTWAR